jgi:NitT/TauT family transport system substrate-binding protein
VVNRAPRRPWSQYFCGTVYSRGEFAQKHRVAIKRALRAILKAADGWALEPEGATPFLVDRGDTARYDSTRQAMQALVDGKWREYDHEETVRF